MEPLAFFFFKLIAVLFRSGLFTHLMFSLCIKLESTTGHWASQARDFQLWLKSQNLLLISWVEQQREARVSFKNKFNTFHRLRGISFRLSSQAILLAAWEAGQHLSIFLQILLWFCKLTPTTRESRTEPRSSPPLLLSASKLTAWPRFPSLETGVVKNSCPLPTLHFLERSCTQAELMSRQSKRTAVKAENTHTNIAKMRMQTYL